MTILKLNFNRFLFLAAISVFLISCGNGSTNKKDYEAIVTSKKWSYDTDAIRTACEALDLSPQEMNIVGRTLTNLGGASFEFREDGKMFLDLPSRTMEGKWYISPDAKLFSFGLAGSVISDHPIKEITPNKISLESGEGGGIFFPRIFKVAETASTEGQ